MSARENVLLVCSLGHLDMRTELDAPQIVQDGHDLLNQVPESAGFGLQIMVPVSVA